MARQRGRVRFAFFIVFLSLISLIYIVVSHRLGVDKDTYIREEQSQRLVLSRLEYERSELYKELSMAGTDAYIENVARMQYGFLKPTDIRFEIINPEALFENDQTDILITILSD